MFGDSGSLRVNSTHSLSPQLFSAVRNRQLKICRIKMVYGFAFVRSFDSVICNYTVFTLFVFLTRCATVHVFVVRLSSFSFHSVRQLGIYYVLLLLFLLNVLFSQMILVSVVHIVPESESYLIIIHWLLEAIYIYTCGYSHHRHIISSHIQILCVLSSSWSFQCHHILVINMIICVIILHTSYTRARALA